MRPDAAIKWLYEAAKYFEGRHGEDISHWSNVYNAMNCRKIAALLEVDQNTHAPDMLTAGQALLKSLRSFADAPSPDIEDQRWHFEVLPAERALKDAIAKAEDALHTGGQDQ